MYQEINFGYSEIQPSIEETVREEAHQWWNRISLSYKQILSSLYNFTGRNNIESVYLKANYGKLYGDDKN